MSLEAISNFGHKAFEATTKFGKEAFEATTKFGEKAFNFTVTHGKDAVNFVSTNAAPLLDRINAVLGTAFNNLEKFHPFFGSDLGKGVVFIGGAALAVGAITLTVYAAKKCFAFCCKAPNPV